ncbi:hypothetical protein [Paenibacillus sp. TY11]
MMGETFARLPFYFKKTPILFGRMTWRAMWLFLLYTLKSTNLLKKQ